MKKKIKILHVTKGFYPEVVGGIETFIDLISSELKDYCEFGLFCIGNKTTFYKYKNIKVYKFKKTFEIASCPFSIDALKYFKKISLNYDICHFHYPYPFMDILNLFILKKKKITTYHSDIVRQKILNFFYNPLKKIFLKNQNKIITTSLQYLRTSKDLQMVKKKTEIINFGVNSKKVKLDKNFKKKYILFIGSIRYYKGLNVLLEAAKKIKTNIYICGQGKELKKLILMKKKFNLNNVFFLGRVGENKKNKLLKHCQLFVFPSNARSEAFGIAILEAMSFAKPIISCNVGSATSFINKNNVTGYVIQPNNPKILAKKINFLLNCKHKKILNKFSTQSYQRFKRYFSSKVMAQKYLNVYESLA